jgi:two-component system response regulator
MPSHKPVLLLVEDDPDQQLLISLALQEATPPVGIRSVASGEMALQYLYGLPPFDDRMRFPRPALVVLDIGLPGVSGFDVLKTIRESESLRDIPVLILTILDEAHYRERALELGATAFCPKPDDFSLITPFVQALLRGERVQA